MKYKNLYVYFFLIFIIFLLTKNIQGIKSNKNMPSSNSSDFEELTDSPIFPNFEDIDILNTSENIDSSESSDPLEPSDTQIHKSTDSIDPSDSTSQIPDSSKSTDLSENLDTIDIPNTIDYLEPSYSLPEVPDSSIPFTFEISDSTFPSDSSEIPIPSDTSEIIVYEPIIIYNLTMNESESEKFIEIQLNRINKTNKSEENLEAYIGIDFNIESFNEINLELYTEGIPIEILFYESNDIDGIINNTTQANKSFINKLTIRTFDLQQQLPLYYFKLIEDNILLNMTSKNYTAKIWLQNDPYNNTIDDNFYNKTQESCIFYYKIDKDIMNKNKTIILTLLSSSMKDFQISYKIVEIKNETKYQNPILLNKTFFNGYSLIINNKLFERDKKEKLIKFELVLDNNKDIIHIKTRKYNSNRTYIGINNPVNIFLNDQIEKECFSLNQSKKNNQYIFNFISLTKNIDFSYCNNQGFKINKESMAKKLEINNTCSGICFKLNNNENNGSMSFEIKPLKNEASQGNIIIPNNYIIRDLWTHHYLYSGTASLYKPEVYNINNLVESFAKISFHIIKGNPLLYIEYCNSTNNDKSNCSFTEGNFIEKKNYQDLNGFISDKKNIASIYDNLTALIYCPKEQNKDCEFDIEIKNENEETYLFPNFRIHSFIINGKNESYKIYEKDINKKYLSIDVNYFPFEAELEIYKDNVNIKENSIQKIYTEKNKLSYLILNETSIENYLSIKISGNTNLYYGIYIKTITEEERLTHTIENNILYYYQPKEKNTYFDFINKEPNYLCSYILNLNTFGNDLILKINNFKKIEPDNDLIQVQLNNNDSFIIENLKHNESEKYLFNIEYHEILEHNKTIIENGLIYKNSINFYNKEANYYFFLFKNDMIEKIVINIRKDSDIPISIEIIGINNNNNSPIKVKELSKIIVFEKEEIKCNGNNDNFAEYCEYKIIIKADSTINNEKIDFIVQLTKYENNQNLIYLPENYFMSNLLIPNFTQSYYFEIEKENEGKIFLDFLEGEGYAEAEISENDGKLGLDYYNKAIVINKEKTQNCDKICKIKINLFLNKSFVYDSMYKYNIYSIIKKSNKNSFYFNVPELQYIYSNLEGQNPIDYYKTKITKKSNKIALYVYCDDCLINISYNNSVLVYNFNILIKDMIILNSSTNFIEKEIKYSIKNNQKVNSQRYNIRLISYENNGEKLYIPMNSVRNAFCKIKANEPCYFIIPKEKYNNIGKIIFLVPKVENPIIILEKDLGIEGENSYQNINYINQNNNYVYQYNQIIANETEKMYKLEIKLNYETIITFVSLHYNIKSNPMNYLYPEDYYIIDINNKNNIEIVPIKSSTFLLYDINLVKGKGEVKILDNNKNIVLEPGFKENVNLIFNSSKPRVQISVQTNSIFFYRIINNKNNNLVEMNFQKSTYFYYLNLNNGFKIWPLYFFTEINLGKDEDIDLKDINLNYKFWKNYSNINSFNPKYESYNTELYLVNKGYIANSKFDYQKYEIYKNLTSISEYRYDFTAGYNFISAKDIKIDNSNFYLIIKIDYNCNQEISDKFDNEINAVLTAFDFSSNNIFPMNEYLFLLIKGTKNINFGREINGQKNTFIEYVSENLNYSINPNINNNKTIINHGKTFLNLEQNKNYSMSLTENVQSNNTIPNLLIKYGLSINDNYSYFKIPNETIVLNGKEIIIEPIIKNPQNIEDNNNEELDVIYTFKIFQVEDENSFIPEEIYQNKKMPFFELKKYINNPENNIFFDTSAITELGYYYINILAEARKGNIYEYLAYKPLFIQNISNNMTVHLNITSKNGNYTPKYTRLVKYIAHIDNSDSQAYIRLSLEHNNYYDKNEIYVSKKYSFLESKEFYKDSEFKVIDRDTSLIIPIKDINSEFYIRIPCNELCDYTLNFAIIKIDNIEINDNECFDIKLDLNLPNCFYRFKNINQTSLITITGDSIKPFLVKKKEIKEGINNYLLERTYFNGYSYLIQPLESSRITIHNFTIDEINESRLFKICHRFITDINTAKKIFIGEQKYIRFDKKNECFSIYKNETYEENKNIIQYRLNFITKTKNINITLYYNNSYIKSEILENEESFIYDFNSSYDGFCISKSDKVSSNFQDTALFQLLSIQKESYINQSLVMPLIKGIFIKQKLKKGEILYYRINNNTENSENIRVLFQPLSGKPKIYNSKCHNYPNCSFNKDNITELEPYEIKNYSTYFNLTIEEKDIYQKSKFPIVLVYCTPDDIDDCNYFIEMANDFETILLNKNRKIYSLIESEINHTYQIIHPFFKGSTSNNPKIYIQFHRFVGESKIIINNFDENNNYFYEYNEDGMFYIIDLKDENENEYPSEFNITIFGNNSYYSLFYYLIYDDDNDNIYLPYGEVHYSIIGNNFYKYHFQDFLNNTNGSYLVSLNALNCYLNAYPEKKVEQNQNKKNYQFIIYSKENILVSCNLGLSDRCEFTISAFELNKDGTSNSLIFNDRIYQYYNFLNKFNEINLEYLISKDDVLNKEIFININKKSKEKIIITYKNENFIVNDYNELINFTLKEDITYKEFNLFHLKINIKPDISDLNRTNIPFKIKINGNKNKYSYFDIEEIENGFIRKEEKINYYYEYSNNEQIYLDSKGLAKFENISIYYSNENGIKRRLYNNYNENEFFQQNDNYIYLIGDECTKGCKIYFSLSLKENKSFCYYNIYQLSDSNNLNIQKNFNIYGNLFDNSEHLFKIELNESDNSILFNLICLSCKITFININNVNNLEKSGIINLDLFNYSEPLLFKVEKSDKTNENDKNDYYFNIIDINVPKFIYQSETNFCSSKCKFILPLYNFYNYERDIIVFYVPDNENVLIYEKIIPLNSSYEDLHYFNLTENYQSKLIQYKIPNGILFNISELKEEGGYIQIQVECKNKTFDFIISQFYNLLNNDSYYPQNILFINNQNINYRNILNNNKLKIELINGSGIVSIDNNNYTLDYETQERVYILNNKINNLIKSNDYYSTSEEDFILYINVEKFNDNFYIPIQKTTYLKIYEKEEKLNINLKIDNIPNKDLYINFHFSKLEPRIMGKSHYINSTKDAFKFSINDIVINITQNKDEKKEKYNGKYCIYNDEQRRGYIYLSSYYINNNIKNVDLILKIESLKIEKEKLKSYNEVFLEVTPIYDENNSIMKIPRNVYLEFNNNNKSIYFSRPNRDYKNVECEIFSRHNINISLISNSSDYKIEKNDNLGKYLIKLDDDISLDYNIKIISNEKENILVKCLARKNSIYKFEPPTGKITVYSEEYDSENINITHPIINIGDMNIKLTYLIRLYNVLDYMNDYEIENIFGEIYTNNTFRKEVTSEELNQEALYYRINNLTLVYGHYILSIIGEIYYNESVEYFFVGSEKFEHITEKPIKFDKTWIIALVLVIIIFIIIVLYLIKAYINKKKEKKEKKTKISDDNGKFLKNKIEV